MPQVGLEPTPHELKARCSNQLSYWSIFLKKHQPIHISFFFIGSVGFEPTFTNWNYVELTIIRTLACYCNLLQDTLEIVNAFFEPQVGLEPTTYSLRENRSATELLRHGTSINIFLSLK